jgi:hypothetical protein
LNRAHVRSARVAIGQSCATNGIFESVIEI